MKKIFFVLSLFIASSLFAENLNLCYQALAQMDVIKKTYIPADTDSCLSDDDCIILPAPNYHPPEAINKQTAAAYAAMKQDVDYDRYTRQADNNCPDFPHPTVIYRAHKSAACIAQKCVPN